MSAMSDLLPCQVRPTLRTAIVCVPMALLGVSMTLLPATNAIALMQNEPDRATKNDDAGADRARRTAHGLLQRGMVKEAIEEYRTALRLAPRHELADEARYGLAMALVRSNEHRAAVEVLAELNTTNPAFRYRVESLYLRGRAYLALKDEAAAQQAFFAAASVDAEHALADSALVAAIELASRRADDAFILAHAPSWIDHAGTHEESPRVRYALGLALHRADRHDEVITIIEPLMSERVISSSITPRAAYLMARSHEALGDDEAALAAYTRAARAEDSDVAAAASFARAFLLEERGRPDEAIPALQEVVRAWPDDPQAPAARLHLAIMLVNQDRSDEAIPFLQELDEHTRYAHDSTYWLAKAEVALGRFDQAADRLARARASAEPGKDRLAAEMLYDEAVALYRGGHVQSAADRFDSFIQAHADHSLAPEALRMTAMLWHEVGDHRTSLARCTQYLELIDQQGVHRPAIEFLAAENMLLSGMTAEAVEQYRAVSTRFPESDAAPIALRRAGEALVRLQRADEATEVLQRAVVSARSEADRVQALRWLGEASFTQADWPGAERALSETISGLGESSPVRASLWLKLGLAQARQGKHEPALAAFTSAHEETADEAVRAQTHFERGQALVALKRDSEAEKAFQQVIRAGAAGERFAAYAWNHLGAIGERAGEWQDAERAYEHAARDASLRAEALWRLAIVVERSGDAARAPSAWREAAEAQRDADRAAAASLRAVLAVARAGEAERTLGAFEEITPEMIESAPESLRGSLRYEFAWSLKRTGQAAEARAAYAALLADDSAEEAHHCYAQLDLADLDLMDEAYDAALARLTPLLDRAAEDDRSFDESFRSAIGLRAGQAAFALERFAEAHRAYTIVLDSMDKDDDGASTLIAEVALTAGESAFRAQRWRDAIALLGPLVEREELPQMVREPALLRLGEAHAQLQDWEASRAVLTKHREVFPESAFWHQAAFGVAWADENASRYKEAIEGYQAIVDRHEGVTAARAQFQIGECLFAQRRYDEALREFLKVDILFAAPEWSAAALVEAGRVLEALRRPSEARAQFEAVIQRFPESEWATLARERLRVLTSAAANSRETTRKEQEEE